MDSVDNLQYSFCATSEKYTDEAILKYYDFFVNMGLKSLFQNIIEKSTLDYIVGVLVGMDSNGRKNRGGMAFELACMPLLEAACRKHNVKLLSQKQFKVLREYGFSVSEDIESRKADFIVLDESKQRAINFEVNFYNGTGSKPEEIIDSYINRRADLLANGIQFALVTDGDCWHSASNQLHKGFRHLDYLLNYYMLKHGMADEIMAKTFADGNA